MNNLISRFLLLAVTVFFSSCQKEEIIPQTDFSIISTDYFQIISSYPNGWIKEAKHVNYLGRPNDEFEYYENGYIKSAKIYASNEQQHLYMEINRSEDNKPLWSKYYTREGVLWFETKYLNGLVWEKSVYSEKGISVHRYKEGELVSVEFTLANYSGRSLTIYDKTAGTRIVAIKKDGETVLEDVYPYTENVGASIHTNNHVPLASPFASPEGNYRKIDESYYNSPNWQHNADPIDDVPPFRYFYGFGYNSSNFATKFAVSSELYQSIIEQYPVTEDEVLTVNYKYIEGLSSFLPPLEERRSLNAEMEQDPSLFELKYGNEYIKEVYYGKVIFMIGALRNMPTNDNVAKDIRDLAKKKMNFIIDGKNQLTAIEQEVLDKVWFEVKFFSSLKSHRNGIVLNSNNEYNVVMKEFQDAESSIIQLKYTTFADMFSEN